MGKHPPFPPGILSQQARFRDRGDALIVPGEPITLTATIGQGFLTATVTMTP